MSISFIYKIELAIPETPNQDLEFNTDLIINKTSKNPDIAKHIFFGDMLMTMNDVAVTNKVDYEETITDLVGSVVEFWFQRINGDLAGIKPLYQLDPERQSKLVLARGYLYFSIDIVKTEQNNEIGLYVKHYQNRVIVTRVKANSLAAKHLAIGDHILDVDGTRVSNKNIFGKLITSNLKELGHTNLIIERPSSKESEKWTEWALDAPPSVKIRTDVQTILEKVRNDLIDNKAGPPKLKSILIKHGENKDYDDMPAVSFDDDATVFDIGSDAFGKKLKKVNRSSYQRSTLLSLRNQCQLTHLFWILFKSNMKLGQFHTEMYQSNTKQTSAWSDYNDRRIRFQYLKHAAGVKEASKVEEKWAKAPPVEHFDRQMFVEYFPQLFYDLRYENNMSCIQIFFQT
uniref:PDZ domain-containing protein n=1 Tax=Rhabditophanes sp. KR3021 TaxID=114890 RepID=A0AC35U0R1_9BILA